MTWQDQLRKSLSEEDKIGTSKGVVMADKSETPRTDEAEYDCDCSIQLGGTHAWPEMVTPADFARTLERELLAAQADVKLWRTSSENLSAQLAAAKEIARDAQSANAELLGALREARNVVAGAGHFDLKNKINELLTKHGA